MHQSSERALEYNDGHQFMETALQLKNYFPKKQLLRLDGSTLADVYNSKRNDTWGSIIKAQVIEFVSFIIFCKFENEVTHSISLYYKDLFTIK